MKSSLSVILISDPLHKLGFFQLLFTQMTGALLGFENPIQDAISRIHFAPNSNDLLISSWDSNLRLYDVDNNAVRLAAPSEAALLDCCFQDDSVAFSAGSDGFIRRYDLHSGTNDTVGNHDDIATCVGYSDETRQVVTAGMDRKILFWDTRSANALTFPTNMGSDVESMSLSRLSLIVAIGASVYLYDMRNLEKPQVKESLMDVQIGCVSSVPYSQGFALGSKDGRVSLDISCPDHADDIRYIFRCHPKSKAGKKHLVVHGAFVTGDNEGFVTLWDFQSKRRLLELPRYPNSVASLSFNRGGRLLAVASSYTYQEANEIEEPPQIFINELDDDNIRSDSAGSCCRS